MSNSVNIPESVKEIKNAITRRTAILAEWQTLLAKSRKNSLRASRQSQVNATREQIVELQNALAIAIEEQEHQKAVAFVASLESVRKDFLNGLFD
jgi:beta-glucosidase-like glycosyl hydrolase